MEQVKGGWDRWEGMGTGEMGMGQVGGDRDRWEGGQVNQWVEL